MDSLGSSLIMASITTESAGLFFGYIVQLFRLLPKETVVIVSDLK